MKTGIQIHMFLVPRRSLPSNALVGGGDDVWIPPSAEGMTNKLSLWTDSKYGLTKPETDHTLLLGITFRF